MQAKNTRYSSSESSREVEVEPSKKRHEFIKYGCDVTVRSNAVGETLNQTLPSIEQGSHHLALVGYDMYTEFDCSRENPSFLSPFKHWLDVQELVAASCGSRPSL